MRFSVIMPSYLGYYPNAAGNRPGKFIRAVNSLLAQTFQDFEIIIVGDGCELTGQLIDKYYPRTNNLRYIPIPKQRLWSGAVRNYGIDAARGEFITYLDTDDALGPEHLSIINGGLGAYDWVWYDDYIVNAQLYPVLNPCALQFGKCGTSNITHRRALGMRWLDSTYRHDWKFIQQLMQHPNRAKITAPEYWICHIPKTRNSTGLDV